MTVDDVRRLLSTHPDFRSKMSGRVKDDDPLMESGIVDSFGLIELVTRLEESFRFKAEPEDLVKENFSTIRRIAAFVDRKSGRRPPA
jgi:acyl carrier protein